MKTKFFTSTIAMGLLVSPAMAATTYYSFPDASQSEYMQPDAIYKNAAISENMDDVDGTEGNDIVNGVPQYDNCPVAYPNTDSSATLLDQCYRSCTTSDVSNIATGATVSGKYYRGSITNGNAAINACVPSACRTGYLKVNVDFETEFSGAAATAAAGIGQNGTIRQVDYAGSSGSIITSDGNGGYNDGLNIGDWAVQFSGKGQLFGSSFCTTQSDVTVGAPNPNGGANCYCYITGYRPNNAYGDNTIFPAQSLRVFLGEEGSIIGNEGGGYSCANNCAVSCAAAVAGASYPSFENRDLLLSYASLTNKCVKNSNNITIVWDGVEVGVDGSAVVDGKTTTNVIYGFDVKTPLLPAHKEGKIFKGWEFVNPNKD